MQAFKVKSTTESGLLVALTVIMALMAMYLPVIGIVATMLWPLPIIVLIVRHGMKYGILSVVASAIIMTILMSPVNAVHMIAAFAPASLALGWGFYKNLSAGRILFYGLIASLIGVFLTAGITMAMTGVNPLLLTEQISTMKESSDAMMSFYGTMGTSPEEIAQFQQEFDSAMQYMTLLFPTIFLLSGMITAWLNFAVGGRVLRRLGHPVAELPCFDEWRLPRLVFYVFAFALIGLYWGTTREIILLEQLSLNAYVLSTLAGFIDGAAVLSALLRNRLRRTFFWILLIFIFFNGLISQILSICGLFDLIFDYRKRFRK